MANGGGGALPILLKNMQDRHARNKAEFDKSAATYQSVIQDEKATPEARKSAEDGYKAMQDAARMNTPQSIAGYYGDMLSKVGKKLVDFGAGKGSKGKGKKPQGGEPQPQGDKQPQPSQMAPMGVNPPPDAAAQGAPALPPTQNGPTVQTPDNKPQRPPNELPGPPLKQGILSKALHGAERGLGMIGGAALMTAGGVLQGATRIANGPPAVRPQPIDPAMFLKNPVGTDESAKRKMMLGEIESNPDLSDEEKKNARAKVYGVTEKPLMKAYKLPNGQIMWADSNHPENLPAGATAVVTGAESKPTVAGTDIAQYNEAVGKGEKRSFAEWRAAQTSAGSSGAKVPISRTSTRETIDPSTGLKTTSTSSTVTAPVRPSSVLNVARPSSTPAPKVTGNSPKKGPAPDGTVNPNYTAQIKAAALQWAQHGIEPGQKIKPLAEQYMQEVGIQPIPKLTSGESKNAQLAQVATKAIDRALDILKASPQSFGPIGGAEAFVKKITGGDNSVIMRFSEDVSNEAKASIGVHSMRAVGVLNHQVEMDGRIYSSPETLASALLENRKSSAEFLLPSRFRPTEPNQQKVRKVAESLNPKNEKAQKPATSQAIHVSAEDMK